MNVLINSFCLSSLLGTLTRCGHGDIHGFFVGSVSTRQSRSIRSLSQSFTSEDFDLTQSLMSDSTPLVPQLQDFEEDSKHEGNTLHQNKTIVTISSFVLSDADWYDHRGVIIEDVISQQLNSITQSGKIIVGWFMWRQYTPLKLSLRQIMTHHQLATRLTPHDENFIFGSFSCDKPQDLFSIKYKFFRKRSATHTNHDMDTLSPLSAVRVTVQNLIQQANTENYSVRAHHDTRQQNSSLNHVESMTMAAVQELETHFTETIQDLTTMGQQVSQSRQALYDKMRRMHELRKQVQIK
jgi:hypothetical protein